MTIAPVLEVWSMPGTTPGVPETVVIFTVPPPAFFTELAFPVCPIESVVMLIVPVEALLIEAADPLALPMVATVPNWSVPVDALFMVVPLLPPVDMVTVPKVRVPVPVYSNMVAFTAVIMAVT